MTIYIIKDIKDEVYFCSFNKEKYELLKSFSDLAVDEYDKFTKDLKRYKDDYVENLENKNQFFSCELHKENELKEIEKNFYNNYDFKYQKYITLTNFEEINLTE